MPRNRMLLITSLAAIFLLAVSFQLSNMASSELLLGLSSSFYSGLFLGLAIPFVVTSFVIWLRSSEN